MSRNDSRASSMHRVPSGWPGRMPLESTAIELRPAADIDHPREHAEDAIGESFETHPDITRAIADFEICPQHFVLKVALRDFDPHGNRCAGRGSGAIDLDPFDADGQHIGIGITGQHPAATELADRVEDAGIDQQHRIGSAGKERPLRWHRDLGVETGAGHCAQAAEALEGRAVEHVPFAVDFRGGEPPGLGSLDLSEGDLDVLAILRTEQGRGRGVGRGGPRGKQGHFNRLNAGGRVGSDQSAAGLNRKRVGILERQPTRRPHVFETDQLQPRSQTTADLGNHFDRHRHGHNRQAFFQRLVVRGVNEVMVGQVAVFGQVQQRSAMISSPGAR